MVDLDLLFKESDISRGAELLRTLGYEPVLSIPAALEDLDRRHNCNLVVVSRQRGHKVELHHRLVGHRNEPYGFDTVFPHTQPACFMGTPIVRMAPEDCSSICANMAATTSGIGSNGFVRSLSFYGAGKYKTGIA